MSVSIKTSRKIGLFTAISILIGSVIGIGIFFKNNSVFKTNNGEGIFVLISWILAAIISTATAFSFGEASTSVSSNTGLGGWSEKLCGKKFGYFTKYNFGIFYFGILLISFAIFLSESILNIFGINTDVNNIMIYVVLLGFVLITLLVVLNLFASRASQFGQIILSSLKFIPIIMVVLVGLIFFNKNGNNLFIPGNNENIDGFIPSENHIGIVGILGSLPSVLFAFDSFTCVGSIANDAKSQKTVPLAIVIGMLLVSFIYILITIVQILVGSGTVEGVFENMLKDNDTAKNVINIVVKVFMFLSVLGVANSFTITCLRTCDGLVQEKIIAGHQFYAKIGGNRPMFAGSMLFGIVAIFWFIICATLSVVFKHDAFVDGLSNYPTLFFFAIYGIVVLFTFVNRFTKKVEVKKLNSFIFYPMAVISFLGILLVFCYQFFYENIAKLFIDWKGEVQWGVLFGPNDNKVQIWQASIVFFTMLLLFMIGPVVNFYLNKLITKKLSLNNYSFSENENV